MALVRHRYEQRSLHSDNAGPPPPLLPPEGVGQLVMLIPILSGRELHAQVSPHKSAPVALQSNYLYPPGSLGSRRAGACFDFGLGSSWGRRGGAPLEPPPPPSPSPSRGSRQIHRFEEKEKRGFGRAIGSFSGGGGVALMPLTQAAASAKGKGGKLPPLNTTDLSC